MQSIPTVKSSIYRTTDLSVIFTEDIGKGIGKGSPNCVSILDTEDFIKDPVATDINKINPEKEMMRSKEIEKKTNLLQPNHLKVCISDSMLK